MLGATLKRMPTKENVSSTNSSTRYGIAGPSLGVQGQFIQAHWEAVPFLSVGATVG
ncbi:MAG: hypothetical protein KDF54_08255 [Hydrogenophaga sp.]|nr:hypothetical protein [Hydrogenophaga sp.]